MQCIWYTWNRKWKLYKRHRCDKRKLVHLHLHTSIMPAIGIGTPNLHIGCQHASISIFWWADLDCQNIPSLHCCSHFIVNHCVNNTILWSVAHGLVIDRLTFWWGQVIAITGWLAGTPFIDQAWSCHLKTWGIVVECNLHTMGASQLAWAMPGWIARQCHFFQHCGRC